MSDRAQSGHGHAITTPGADFHERTANAVANPVLQQALHNLDRRLRTAGAAADAHPDWKDRAAAVRRETLLDLDGWLDRLEQSLTARGVHVHRASTPADARRIVVDLSKARGARTAVKSKSMATEEIDLGNALEEAGLTTVETDLGEYIVQLAGERPSHMITPAIHKTLPQIRDVFGARGRHRSRGRSRGTHRVGARTASGRVSPRRRRHHRRELRRGRHGDARAGYERGERALLYHLAAGAHRGDARREGDSASRRPRLLAPAAHEPRHRAGAFELRDHDQRPAPGR